STVFTADVSMARSSVLLAFCSGGVISGLIWAVLGIRASSFSTMSFYEALVAECDAMDGTGGPIQAEKRHRSKVPVLGKLIRAEWLVWVVPLGFAFLYVYLGYVVLGGRAPW
ncbi:MAG: hypothetical protein M0Z94_17985, partial [Dehalococcoidales bacterium]|nr:hypothetical protein [Dehalococcoidales bacterium]